MASSVDWPVPPRLPLTRLPRETRRAPMRPANGAVILANSRSRRASAMVDFAVSMAACALRSSAARLSTVSTEPKSLRLSCWARHSSAAVSTCLAWAVCNWAVAWSSRIWNGRGSMANSGSPARTVCPSVKPMAVSVPPTWARSSTLSTAANWPRNRPVAWTACCSGTLTVTCGGGGGAWGAAPGARRVW